MSSETIETVLRTGTWILAILVPISAAWIATCWIKRSPATLVGRSLFAGFLVFASSAWIHERAMQPFSRAIWRCSVCGTSEYQVRFSDRVVYRWGGHASNDKTVAAIASGVPHEHDWLYWLAIIAYGDKDFECTCGFGDECDEYFHCLDQIPSPEIARSMVARVACGSLEERRSLIHVFDTPQVGVPFTGLWRDEPIPTREQFEKDYVAWLDRHPEWK